MIVHAFIRHITQRRPFEGRNGKQCCYTLRVEVPYLTASGTLGYDAILADYYDEDTPEAVERIEACYDKEVQMTLFFNIRDYDHPTKGLMKFQSIRVHNFKQYART